MTAQGLRVLLLGWLVTAAVAASTQRIGFREDFTAPGDWQIADWPGLTGMADITSNGEQATFTTLAGTFMTGASAAWAPDWPDWDRETPAGLAMIVRKYPVTVDLDRYHYLVAHVTHSGTYMALAVNGWDTKACYTTGLHAVDLRDIEKPSLQGRQPVELRLTFLNTGGRVTLDEVRLVESLTPEEQAGFIPAGLDLRLERREPQPYHGLEVLNDRAGAPVRLDTPQERTVFRDTSTGAVVWKLTRSVRTEMADRFNADGSILPIYNRSFRGFTVYDLAAGAIREFPDLRGSPVLSRTDPNVMYLLESGEREGRAHYTIRAVDLRGGAVSEVAQWDSPDGGSAEFGASPYSARLILGLKEGRALYLIDPRATVEERVRRVPLPMRMKGSYYSDDDSCVNWQRCYFFQRWRMDLDTGDIRLAHYPTYGGHEIFGRGVLVGRYVTMMLTHPVGLLPCDETNGEQVRIWSNWRTDVPSDYGQLAADDRWLVTNGTEGAVAGKRLLIDGHETGTVMQIVHDFTSRNSWDSNTYTRISPDATKIAYMCDMLGDTDVYVAVTRRPEAPLGLTLRQDGDAVRLTWEPPDAAREIAGYNVYRSTRSGRDCRRVNDRLVDGTEYVDSPPAGPVFYAVAAQEHSGLEGLYSNEAHLGNGSAPRIYADPEEGELSPPMRRHFDGRCSNFRCARVWKEAPEEVTGRAGLTVDVQAESPYYVWLRAQGQGSVHASAGDASTTVQVDAAAWGWVRAAEPLLLPHGPQQVTLESVDDGLCLDLLMLTTDPADHPTGVDDRDPTPSPVRELRIAEATANEVRLAWRAAAEPDLDYYSVYVGDDPDFSPGNSGLLASGRGTVALDWGYRPGATLYYKVVPVNKRGVAGQPAMVRVDTPPIETATIQLDIKDATLAGGLERTESQGVACAFLPAPLAQDAPRPKATWGVDVPHSGRYYLWARYTTYDAKRVSLFWVDSDGDGQLQGSNWRLRFPNTLTRHLDGVTPGEETWFTDKMMSGWWAGPFDSLDLAAGAHTLAVAFEPTHAPNGPRLATVYLSSDPSYRPPGFDPRVDFSK